MGDAVVCGVCEVSIRHVSEVHFVDAYDWPVCAECAGERCTECGQRAGELVVCGVCDSNLCSVCHVGDGTGSVLCFTCADAIPALGEDEIPW